MYVEMGSGQGQGIIKNMYKHKRPRTFVAMFLVSIVVLALLVYESIFVSLFEIHNTSMQQTFSYKTNRF